MPYTLALICVFLPLVSVHLTLTIGIGVGNLDLCNPYWSDCHSISATGRQYPEFFVFKALLIPTAVCMMAYWLLLHQWIVRLTNGEYRPYPVTFMGLIAGVALIVYTVTLGAHGDAYALARRIGVVFYFAFTALGHLVLLRYLDKVDTQRLNIVTQQNRLIVASIILIGTAILSAIVGLLWEEWWDRWENAYEWWFSLLMISMFYHVAAMWKITDYRITLQVGQ